MRHCPLSSSTDSALMKHCSPSLSPHNALMKHCPPSSSPDNHLMRHCLPSSFPDNHLMGQCPLSSSPDNTLMLMRHCSPSSSPDNALMIMLTLSSQATCYISLNRVWFYIWSFCELSDRSICSDIQRSPLSGLQVFSVSSGRSSHSRTFLALVHTVVREGDGESLCLMFSIRDWLTNCVAFDSTHPTLIFYYLRLVHN